MTRLSGVSITVNNPSLADQRFYQHLLEDEAMRAGLGISYLVLQTERTSLLHYQVMMQFSTPKYWDWIRHNISGTHHIERIMNAARLKKYCQKEDTRDTTSVLNVRGEVGVIRMREYDHMTEMILDVKKKFTTKDIMLAYPKSYLVHHRGADKMLGMIQEERRWAPEVEIYYGPTGCGKTWQAIDRPSVYKIPPPVSGGWWWFNYQNQECVVMDEFRNNIKFGVMLEFLDRYPFTIAVKGGNQTMNSKKIIITTNISPVDWYPRMRNRDKKPLYRRFQDYCKIYKFKKPEAWNDGFHNRTKDDLIMERMVYSDGLMVPVVDLMTVDEDEDTAELLRHVTGPQAQPVDLNRTLFGDDGNIHIEIPDSMEDDMYLSDHF